MTKFNGVSLDRNDYIKMFEKFAEKEGIFGMIIEQLSTFKKYLPKVYDDAFNYLEGLNLNTEKEFLLYIDANYNDTMDFSRQWLKYQSYLIEIENEMNKK